MVVGRVVSEVRYLPFGGERWRDGVAVTDFGFISQRREEFGLYDYNASYYSPGLGRFVSADTIVPELANPQAFNRYSYVYNNPLIYTDPSGHCPVCVIARILSEVPAYIFPSYETALRQKVGGKVLADAGSTIEQLAPQWNVNPTIARAVIWHESAARERRIFTPLPGMQPRGVAKAAEFSQALLWELFLTDDEATIGPAQSTLSLARQVRPDRSDFENLMALLDEEESVEFALARLSTISDHLVARYPHTPNWQHMRTLKP